MTTRRATVLVTAAAVTILAYSCFDGEVSRAEVSIGDAGSVSSFLLATGGDNPTPYPWGRVRLDASLDLLLEPDADPAVNGGVDFAFDPLVGRHEVVWARFDGNDFEIVRSHWNGVTWSAAEQLTDNAVDDFDPAISFTSSGTSMITWWREGSDQQVWYREKTDGSSWSSEQVVTSLPNTGTRPGVAAFGGGAWIAYQVAQASGNEIRVASQESGWNGVFVAQTSHDGPAGDGAIYVRVHSRAGRLWVDWVDGPGQMAYSVYDVQTETWSAPAIENYSWNPGAGETEFWAREGARERIRFAVFR